MHGAAIAEDWYGALLLITPSTNLRLVPLPQEGGIKGPLYLLILSF